MAKLSLLVPKHGCHGQHTKQLAHFFGLSADMQGCAVVNLKDWKLVYEKRTLTQMHTRTYIHTYTRPHVVQVICGENVA